MMAGGIGYKILDSVLGKELFHLTVELAGQSFVVGYDESRLIERSNDIRHCECLAGARHAKKGFKLVARFETLYKFFYGLRLIAGRLVF